MSAATNQPVGRVLIVEDEELVRMLVVQALEDVGHAVVETGDPKEAMKLLGEAGPIDLMVTDVGLPGMDGRKLADEAWKRRPELKVLFMTGYAHAPGGELPPHASVIGKPFAVDELADRVGELLQG